MFLAVHFSELSGEEKGRTTGDWAENIRANSPHAFLFPAGLAFRNSQKGGRPQDCLPVFAGKPTGYAEFLAVTRS